MSNSDAEKNPLIGRGWGKTLAAEQWEAEQEKAAWYDFGPPGRTHDRRLAQEKGHDQ